MQWWDTNVLTSWRKTGSCSFTVCITDGFLYSSLFGYFSHHLLHQKYFNIGWSVKDFKTYFVVEILINDYHECKGHSPPLLTEHTCTSIKYRTDVKLLLSLTSYLLTYCMRGMLLVIHLFIIHSACMNENSKCAHAPRGK